MRTVKKDSPAAKVKCGHCGFEDSIPMTSYTVGDVLNPYPGGNDYGYCKRCQRGKTMVVIHVPQPCPTPAKGWSEIPDK